MRSAFLSLLLALAAFALFAALPASLGLLSLVRALVFLFAVACLVAAVPLSLASALGSRTLARGH